VIRKGDFLLQITVSMSDGVLARYQEALRSMPTRARSELARGLNDAGSKTRTLIRRSLREQTNVGR
jgi:hypothetical protein